MEKKRDDKEDPKQICESEYETRKKHPVLHMENGGREEEYRNRDKKKGKCIHSKAARYGRGQMGKKVYKGGNKEH